MGSVVIRYLIPAFVVGIFLSQPFSYPKNQLDGYYYWTGVICQLASSTRIVVLSPGQ